MTTDCDGKRPRQPDRTVMVNRADNRCGFDNLCAELLLGDAGQLQNRRRPAVCLGRRSSVCVRPWYDPARRQVRACALHTADWVEASRFLKTSGALSRSHMIFDGVASVESVLPVIFAYVSAPISRPMVCTSFERPPAEAGNHAIQRFALFVDRRDAVAKNRKT